MKKLAAISMALALGFTILALPACSQQGGSSQEPAATETTTEDAGQEEAPDYADDDFMAALATGLETRWNLSENESPDAYESTDEERAWMLKFVNAELDEVGGFASQPFEDTKLQAAAIQYINVLNDQLAALDYINVDYDKYLTLWNEAYNERSQLITDFVDNYGLTVSEEYQSVLDDFKVNAALVANNAEMQKAIDAIGDGMVFQDEGDGHYVAVVENTTGFDIAEYNADVSLLNADGVIVDTQYIYVSNWGNGQKAQFDFYVYDTSFETTSVKVSYWEAA